MRSNRISALMVVHDGAIWLPEVVASIASQTLPANQILAIDTGSLDSSPKLLKSARIPTLTLDRTTSFGNALAQGVAALPEFAENSGDSSDNGSDNKSDTEIDNEIDNEIDEWLWILHDDCTLDPRALEELVAAIIDRPSIAMAGPKLLGWHDRTHLLEAGISIATNGSRWTGLEPHEYDQGQRDGTHEVLAVSTAGALIRRRVFEELGGFDSNLELFRDDVDFGWRLHAAGHSALVVTSAIGYHAQAAATERRAIDIAGAPLHRPLLLDRRNAAYVLLANSSWWKLPLLVLQLFSGALIRAVAFLFAKLPGYASDEILAIASLLIHPGELFTARKTRRNQRLVSSGIVARFIPSRWDQFRTGASRVIESLRDRIFPEEITDESQIISELELNEDEDLLKPLPGQSWKTIFLKPLILSLSFLTIFSLVWMRSRFGEISGGALATSQAGAADLWRFYVESWHRVGMGSGVEAPSWIFLLAIASTLTFGNVSLFIALIFLIAPFLLLWSSYSLLRRFTSSSSLSAFAALFYALSPISIAAINSGRLGVVILLILLPQLFLYWGDWQRIEERSIRNIFTITLLLWVMAAFNPSLLIPITIFTIFYLIKDYLFCSKNLKSPLFLVRLGRRAILLLIPLVLMVPTSFEYLRNPVKLLLEIGIPQAGGGANLALLANPGGPGSLPWWSFSPITLVLLITFFSSTEARRYSAIGLTFLLAGTLSASLRVKGNGSSAAEPVFSGTFIAVATLLALLAATIMFNNLRTQLERTHLNYQHFTVAAVLIITLFYSATSTIWIFTAGANSPLSNNARSILPAYLTVEEEAKTLVIRPLVSGSGQTLAYSISRGTAIEIGEADIAVELNPILRLAVESLIDNTGVTSSKVLAAYGIQYVFLKKTASAELIQIIDGIGGFTRASATSEGTVWKINDPTGRYLFTDFEGNVTVLDSALGSAIAPGAGTITVTENYSDSWQALADGVQLERSISEFGLPQFKVINEGEIDFLHDGTGRRAWISIFLITLVTSIIMALPAGRRRREMSDSELA